MPYDEEMETGWNPWNAKPTEQTSLEPRNRLATVATSARLVDAFMSGRGPRTMEAYRQDLAEFTRWLGATTPQDAAELLLGSGHGVANETAIRYRAALLERGLAPATVNRRLAAVRSMVKLARTLGMVPWTLEVPSVKGESYRDTRGPGVDGFRSVVEHLTRRIDAGDPKATRDRAAVRLLYDLGLRRGEVVGLDVEHVDLDASTVQILGKGRTQRIALTLPEPTKAALLRWLDVRGRVAGPLFINFDRAGKGGRLTGRGLAYIVTATGEAAGVAVRPHGLRHAAITAALDATNGNMREVQRFSRHRDPRTLMKYDDNRTDIGGKVAALIAGAV